LPGFHASPYIYFMRKIILALILLVLTSVPALAGDYVIVLHGLGRTEDSMLKLVLALNSAGYQVLNLDYDSRHKTIETLADTMLANAIVAAYWNTQRNPRL
jgi:hypothetical protein